MSSDYRNIEDRRTKPLRLWMCASFIAEIILLATPYIAMTDQNGVYYSKTILELILSMDIADIQWLKIGILAIVFAIIPIIGFFFAAFDKNSCVKCAVGCICSFAGIAALTFAIPQFSSTMAVGAMLAMILYLLIFVLSVSLALKTIGVKALKKQEEQTAREHNEA